MNPFLWKLAGLPGPPAFPPGKKQWMKTWQEWFFSQRWHPITSRSKAMIHKRREQRLTMPQRNTPNTHLAELEPSLLEVKCEPYWGLQGTRKNETLQPGPSDLAAPSPAVHAAQGTRRWPVWSRLLGSWRETPPAAEWSTSGQREENAQEPGAAVSTPLPYHHLRKVHTSLSMSLWCIISLSRGLVSCVCWNLFEKNWIIQIY